MKYKIQKLPVGIFWRVDLLCVGTNGLFTYPKTKSLQKVSQKIQHFALDYKKTASTKNKDHVANYEFRESHMHTGELGVTVKTYQTSKDRSNDAEAYYKSI